MSFELIRIDRAVFVDFGGPPTASSLRMIRAELGKARQDAGQPLLYLSVIPLDVSEIGVNARTAMIDFVRYLHTCCKSIHIVIESTGFRGTIVRSMITSIAMLSRERGMLIYSDVHQAMAAIRMSLSPEHGEAFEEAIFQRLGRREAPPTDAPSRPERGAAAPKDRSSSR